MFLRISRVLHAGYVVQTENATIAFDPIYENPFSKNCFAYPAVDFDQPAIQKFPFSAVFISHFHDDHCSFESLNLLDKKTPIYIFCVFEEMIEWIKALGFETVVSLDLNIPVNIGDIRITPLRALDADVDSLFHIQVQDLNILNVVDSWIDPQTFEKLKRTAWDLVLWPFQTMRELEVIAPTRLKFAAGQLPDEWKAQLQEIKPRFLVPSSCQFIFENWSWYNHAFFPISYASFQRQIQALLPDTQITRMEPSLTFQLEKGSFKPVGSLSWVHLKDRSQPDYFYQPEKLPPATAQLAKNFAAVDEEKTSRVIRFCQTEISQRYEKLLWNEEPYFENPRLWQLRVFDHEGQALVFNYQIHEKQMTKTSTENGEMAWLTEVPVSRLYGALECGESLTSMYIRVNDQMFSSQVESLLTEVDVLNDPLIRVLYEGEFGAYQKYQLKNLKNRESTSLDLHARM